MECLVLLKKHFIRLPYLLFMTPEICLQKIGLLILMTSISQQNKMDFLSSCT